MMHHTLNIFICPDRRRLLQTSLLSDNSIQGRFNQVRGQECCISHLGHILALVGTLFQLIAQLTKNSDALSWFCPLSCGEGISLLWSWRPS